MRYAFPIMDKCGQMRTFDCPKSCPKDLFAPKSAPIRAIETSTTSVVYGYYEQVHLLLLLAPERSKFPLQLTLCDIIQST